MLKFTFLKSSINALIGSVKSFLGKSFPQKWEKVELGGKYIRKIPNFTSESNLE